MEDWLICFIAGGFFMLAVFVVGRYTRGQKEHKEEVQANANRAQGQGPRRAVPVANRRVAGARNRNRPQRPNDSDSDDGGGEANVRRDDSDGEAVDAVLNDPKLGAKKRAKLEAKLEKKAHREAEERIREEQKVRDAKLDEERRKRDEEEAEEEKQREAEEQRMKEEQVRREEEEYMKMRASFTVEEEGTAVPDEEEEGNLIEKFISYIKETKVILFEELATKFGLKVPDAIERLNVLVKEGRLTGVMDDRGKFIYISEEELLKFAKFIKQRGRVSIAELVECSADIINIGGKSSEVLES